jgi:hypothetical protein
MDVVKDLMVVSNPRGRYGAGVAVAPLDRKAKIRTLRTIGNSLDLMDTQAFHKMLKKPFPTAIMAHTRYPTMGDWDNEANVHPHQYGSIIGVHNGTMKTILREKVDDKESDSALLFKAIAEKGIRETLETSEGAYALVYMDLSDKTINFVANDQRPLWFARVGQRRDHLFWASEPGMLQFVLHRYFKEKITITFPNPGTLIKFPLYPSKPSVEAMSHTLIEYKEPPRTSVPIAGNENAARQYETYKGHFLFEDDLLNALAQGCSWCSEGYDKTDYLEGKAHWMSDGTTFLCEECAEGEASRYVNHLHNIPSIH